MDKKACLGVILAGGQSSRMGQDKALLKLGNETLLNRAVRRLQHQLDNVIISARSQQAIPAQTALSVPIIPDAPSFTGLGPLTGILSAMEYAQSTSFQALITIAIDTPFFPGHYAACLLGLYKGNVSAPVMAVTNDMFHPTFALWPVSLIPDLRHTLQGAGKKSILAFARRHHVKQACFTPQPPCFINPFFNINTPDELRRAQETSAGMNRENMP